MSDFETLAFGQSMTIGGEGIAAIVVGPLHFALQLKIESWHRGEREGDGSGDSAHLWLRQDGAEIGFADDHDFIHYNLACEATAVLGTGATTSISIERRNHNAREQSFGLQVTATRP